MLLLDKLDKSQARRIRGGGRGRCMHGVITSLNIDPPNLKKFGNYFFEYYSS